MLNRISIFKISILATLLVSLTTYNYRFNYNKEYELHFKNNYELFKNDNDVIIWHPKNLEVNDNAGRLVLISEYVKHSRVFSENIKIKIDSILNSII